ncbi:MAG: gliding motility lipoprotein GldH [Thermoflavifilum aggregans]|nr:gliding motility lipoprotein GldH [Thermoflavifilum aggregans]
MKPNLPSLLLLMLALCCGCQFSTQLNVFEQQTAIPHQSWDAKFRPVFTVHITDTTALYDIYVTLRHTNDYRYSNLWLLITTTYPDGKSIRQRVELPLADATGRWFGSGMEDIFFHRILIQHHAYFNQPGTYRFTFEQDMRDNPLPNVMNIGLRIEKIGRRQPVAAEAEKQVSQPTAQP